MDANKTFETIKAKIRQHEAYELTNYLQHWLYDKRATDVDYMRWYEPWHSLLIFKWIIRFGDFRERQSFVPVADNHINALFDHLKNLSEQVFPLSTRRDLYFTYRASCVQQFWFQRKESILLGWGRQARLFANLEQTHRIRKLFEESVGVDLDDFLDLSYCLFSYFEIDKNRYVTVSTFSQLFESVGQENISLWLRAVSSTVPALQAWLQQTDDAKPKAYQGVESEYHEQTPFLRYPLVEAREKFIVISPHALRVSLSSIVYDILRDQRTKERFMNRFGTWFGNYVHEALTVLKCPLFTEDDLRDHLNASGSQKLVDFLAVDKGNNIFIEVKGVALSWKGTVSRRSGTLRNESETSVLKAIEQAYDVASTLEKETSVNGCSLGTQRNFLLVVTYKDMYFGNGKNFHDFIASDEIDRIISQHDNREVIPLSNIFVICVDDLEIMLGDILNSDLSLSDFLERAADHNPEDISRTLAFRNISSAVSGREKIHELPMLTAARDALLARVAKRFKRR
ncbi:MAG: hypothetical protein OXG53_06020 [Chloroflexi bacterium]|nr:hypothetical protein [Chloroflexota bacterium]